MARVPSSGATMVSDVSSVEVWDPHSAKSDGAVVSLVAVVTANDSVQGGLDAGEIFQQSFVDGSDIYGRSDFATVSLTALPSSIDGLVFLDAATLTLASEPSATEFHSVIYSDTATTSLTAEVSGSDVAAYTDSARAFLVADIYSRTDEATVSMVAYEVENDDTHQMVDVAIVSMTAVPSPQWEAHKNVDQDTVTLTGVPSGIDGKTWSDDAVVRTIGIASSTDFLGHTYLDSFTVPVTGTPSGTDLKAHGYEDAADVVLTGIPSGIDEKDNVAVPDMKFFGANGDSAAGDTHSLNASLNGGAAVAGDILVVNTVSAVTTSVVVSDDISSTTGWIKIGDSLTDDTPSLGFATTKWWKICVGGETSVTCDWSPSGNGRAFEALICRGMGPFNEVYMMNEGLAFTHFGSKEFGQGDGSGTIVTVSSNNEIYIGATAIGNSNYTLAEFQGIGAHDNNGVTGNGQNVGGSSVGFGVIMHINDDYPNNHTTDTIRYLSEPNVETFHSLMGIRVA